MSHGKDKEDFHRTRLQGGFAAIHEGSARPFITAETQRCHDETIVRLR